MVHRIAWTVLATSSLAACAAGSPSPVTSTPPTPADPAVIVSAVPASALASAPAPVVSAPLPDGDSEERVHRIDLELQPGAPKCRLVFESGMFELQQDWFSAAMITRIATEASPGCAAGTLYDLSKETKAKPDDLDPDVLQGGLFRMPGRPETEETKESWNHFEDLNFDQNADLCVVNMTGAYNYSHRCWLFDPTSRTFVRNADLEEVIFMTIDRTKKTLSNSMRAGGPHYMRAEYAWIGGKLAVLWSENIILGEKPDGKSIPGKQWVVRYERKGNKLVKVREGAQKSD